jgi:hypothetical protein
MASGGDAKAFKNISTTTAAFVLYGGLYGVSVLGTGFGTVTLQALGPDQTTYLTALTAFAANGYASAYLAPGQYRFLVTSATAAYLAISRIN